MWDRAASVEYAGRVGVGCVVAPGVILTSRHVVEESAGTGGQPRIVQVLGGGMSGPRARVEVAWRRGDAALLRCRPRDLGVEFAPVRWGELTCTKPPAPPECSAVGLPRAALRRLGAGPEDERSQHEPHGAAVRIDIVDNTSRTYGLQIDHQPTVQLEGMMDSTAWEGMSGAAVFCRDLLMGMVTRTSAGGSTGHLEAVPVRQLLEDRRFCDIVEEASGRRPRLEAADLDGLFEGLPQPVAAASYFLSPRSEVVDFVGLDAEISALYDWCSTAQSVDISVVRGPSGVGKTRLGVELARRLSERRPEAECYPDSPEVPWTAGFLSAAPAQHTPAYAMFRYLTRPALIVIDNAEFRLDQVEQLLSALLGHQTPGRRIRIVLLAHSTGGWWEQLRARYPAMISGSVIPLEPGALYRHHTPAQVQELAELSFSKRIVALHRAGVPDDWDGYQAADQRAATAADTLRAGEKDPDGAIPGTVINDHRKVLSVHMDALTSVLINAPGELTDHLPASTTLLAHEMNYIQRGAGNQGLQHSDPGLLRALVALQGMAGAQNEEEADSLIETAWAFHHRRTPRTLDPATRQKLHRTISSLYPAPGKGPSGDTGPDTLTGAHINHLEADSHNEFLKYVLPHLSRRQRQHSLALIARSISTWPQLAESAAQAIASHPLALAVPATKVVEQLPETAREVWLKSIGNAASRRTHQQTTHHTKPPTSHPTTAATNHPTNHPTSSPRPPTNNRPATPRNDPTPTP
ncbi:MAG TPA: trypsin-like peptidase domain-containing protein, partial [Streptomyces sp.]|nr:trypsin-like peptidase domain-containing protein [Streptomyces sp.]